MSANKVRKRIALFPRPRNYSRVAVVVVFLLPTPCQIPVFIHCSIAVVPMVLLIPQKAISASPSLTRVSRQVGQRGYM